VLPHGHRGAATTQPSPRQPAHTCPPTPPRMDVKRFLREREKGEEARGGGALR